MLESAHVAHNLWDIKMHSKKLTVKLHMHNITDLIQTLDEVNDSHTQAFQTIIQPLLLKLGLVSLCEAWVG